MTARKRGEAGSRRVRPERSQKPKEARSAGWVLAQSEGLISVAEASQRDNAEARSRREQRGWSGAKGKAQPPRSGGGFCLRRSEAARREQAQRDNAEARSRREMRDNRRGERYDPFTHAV